MSAPSLGDFPPGPLAIEPLAGRSSAHPFVWDVPGSKSITNRALVLAALTPGVTELSGVLHSDDTRHMRAALEALGVLVEDLDATTLRVHGGRSRLHAPDGPLFVGNSGTTVRFLTALAALVPGAVTLVGDEHMQKRPIADLVVALRALGVAVDCPTGCPPLTVHGGRLPGGVVSMPGDKSSQYFSALLMAAPEADGPLTIRVEDSLVSRPYVGMTLRMLADFGAQAASDATSFEVAAGGYAAPSEGTRRYAIEPDASAASYAFGAAAALDLEVWVPRLGRGTLQGDYGFLDLLEQGGAWVERGAEATRVRGRGALEGLAVDMHHISDTVMTLAALAPLARGPTRIRNVGNIRLKETDRLAATAAELRRLGQEVDSGQDWLSIVPRPTTPAVVRCYADHRMAMAFALLGLARPGVSIEDPACVAKTYPGYWRALEALARHLGAPT